MTSLPFDTSGKFSPEETALRDWLKANRERLAGHEPAEVAQLAVLCGFDLDVVCMTLVNFRDAMAGSHIDNRAALEAWRFDMTLEHIEETKREMAKVKELDLMPMWQELVAHTITGEVKP